jgi:hypothetical protein
MTGIAPDANISKPMRSKEAKTAIVVIQYVPAKRNGVLPILPVSLVTECSGRRPEVCIRR